MRFIHGSLKHSMEELNSIKHAEGQERLSRDNEPASDSTGNVFAMYLAFLIVVIPAILFAVAVLLLVFWLFTG